LGPRAGDENPQSLQSAERGLKGDLAKRDNDRSVAEDLKFPDQVCVAVLKLAREGPVLRRSTTESGRHIAVAKLQSIALADRGRLVGKTELVDSLEEPVSASVSCKDPTCAVASMSRRRQSDHEQPGGRVSEARQRLRPVLPVTVARRLSRGNRLEVRDQPRTEFTADDPVVQFLER
jgi:hypothetical protein